MNSIDLYEKIPNEEENFPVRLLPSKGITMFAPHWHEHTELLFFTKGESKISSGGEVINVHPGDLVVVNSNEIHYKERSNCDYLCIILNPSFFSDTGFDNIRIKHFISGDAFIKNCFENIFDEYEKNADGCRMAIKSNAYALMTYLWRNYAYLEKTDDAHTELSKRLGKAVKYIQEHYTERITTADLAKVCYVSEYYFCRFFKKMTGLSAVNYINSVRIEKAMSFLDNTSATVTQIALKTGFDDLNYFSRVFKKLVGMSPTQYRKAHTDEFFGE